VLRTDCSGCATNETYYSFPFIIINSAQAGASAVFNFAFTPASNSTLSFYKVLTSRAFYPELEVEDYTEVSISATGLSFTLQLGNIPRRSQRYLEVLVIAGDSKPISGALNASVEFVGSSELLSKGGDSLTDSDLTIPEDLEETDQSGYSAVFLGVGYSVDHGEQVAVAVSTTVLAVVGLSLIGLVWHCKRRSVAEPTVKLGLGVHAVRQ
jgi:hypothetical protein